MTLSITVAKPKYICQATDRRLVRLGSKSQFYTYTDQASKALYLQLRDISVMMSYHGIGEDVSKTRTQSWLIEQLKRIRAHENSAEKVFLHIAEQATLWMRHIYRICPTSQRYLLRHTFHAVGWHPSGNPAFYQISNFERLDTDEESAEPWPEFRFEHIIIPPKSSRTTISGAHQAVGKEDKELLLKATQILGIKPEDVINLMVRTIQNAARSKLISKNCISCIMLPSAAPQCRYHSPNGAGVSYAPDYFGEIILSDVQVFFGNEPAPYRVKQTAEKYGLTVEQIYKELELLPASYVTGDPLPREMTSRMKRFLEELPEATTLYRIKDSL